VGFREKDPTYVLTFEGDAYEGLIVKVSETPFGEQQKLESQNADLVPLIGKKPEEIKAEEFAAALEHSKGLVDAFLDHLVEWNIEDATGDPIPATREGMARVSTTLGRHVIKTWWEFVSGEISAPLGSGSSSGAPSLEASLPMEPLSPSHTSSPALSSSSAPASDSGVSRAS